MVFSSKLRRIKKCALTFLASYNAEHLKRKLFLTFQFIAFPLKLSCQAQEVSIEIRKFLTQVYVPHCCFRTSASKNTAHNMGKVSTVIKKLLANQTKN